MILKIRLPHWLLGAALLAGAQSIGAVTFQLALTGPAAAQFFRDDYPRQQRPRRSGGFFENLFGGSNRSYERGDSYQQPQQHIESSRAPAPHKPDPNAPAPTTSVVVMGDGMADWLAYGLEDAFADSPEVGIIRKNKLNSGLIRYEAKGDLDWWHVARDLLAQEKPNYVVMMLGVSDRQNIREKDLAKEADKKAKEQKDAPAGATAPATDKNAQNQDQSDEGEQPSIIAPEQRGKKANGVLEFRTEEWAQVYNRRIDDTIAALKSKGVPVFWVGLPSIRGPKSTADAVYLNDLYRARAEKAGVIYIDVWDGFVDEAGKYSNFGPDYEGQVRRLRSSDGTFFTKYGARKLAHYVERELRRYMNNRAIPVALPSGPITPAPADGRPAERPLAGPVVPLTVTPGNSDTLLGGANTGSAHSDAIASRVLVRGEPVPAATGRADDFAWPHGNDANRGQPVSALPAAAAAASASTINPIVQPEPPKTSQKKAEPKKDEKLTQNTRAKRPIAPHPAASAPPRPPQPVRRNDGLFGLFR